MYPNKGIIKRTNTTRGIPSRRNRSLKYGPAPFLSYEPGVKYPEIKKKRPRKNETEAVMNQASPNSDNGVISRGTKYQKTPAYGAPA